MGRHFIDDFVRERLTLLRKESGLTQAAAAEMAGISEVYLKSIERGARYNLPVQTLEKILTVYGLTVPDVFKEELPKVKVSKVGPVSPHYRRKKAKK